MSRDRLRTRNGISSKLITQGKLHRTRRQRALKFTECKRCLEVEAGIREIRVIEHVKRFRAELNTLAFPRQWENLRNAHVYVVDGRQADSCAGAGTLGRLIPEIRRGVQC